MRLLLCDDESIQRAALKLAISRLTDLPVDIEEASHGQQALERLAHRRADIVFLDLRMPVMGGLEAARIIREQQPETEIIVLTAYDEFNFTQEAIKLGVADYLLKPASEVDLKRVISKVMGLIQDRQRQQEAMALMQRKLAEARPYIQLEYINDLLGGRVADMAALDEKRDFLGLNTHPEMVLLLELDEFNRMTRTKTETERQLLKEQVRKIVRDSTRTTVPSLLARLGGDRFALLLTAPESDLTGEESIMWATSIAEQIRKRVNEETALSITIGLSRRYKDPRNLPYAHTEAQKAISYKFLLGNNHTIKIDDVADSRQLSAPYPYELEEKLAEAVRLADGRKALELLEELAQEIVTTGLNEPERVRWRMLELLVVLNRAAAEGGAEDEALSECNFRHVQLLFEAGSLSEMRDAVIEASERLLQLVSGVRNMRHQQLIRKAIAYMEDNYASALSLEDLARVVYLSPFYFSHIFKEQVGVTFIEYLTSLRINEAKRQLRETLRPVGQIAEHIGYNDVNYFSRVFKKVVGLTPTQYREKRATLSGV